MKTMSLGRLFSRNSVRIAELGLALLLFWRWAPSDYFIVIANMVAIYAIAVMGLNILIGATGQVSIGHAAFFGIAAYTSAILSTTLQFPLWLSLMAAFLLVLVIALIVAVPTLRLEGNYLIMATLGFNIIATIVMNQWENVTGGPSGFANIQRLHILGYSLDTDRKFFLLCWFITLLLTAITLNLQTTRLGRIFKALRDNQTATEASGISTSYYKIIAFLLSSLYAGLGGVLYGHYMTFISPKTFNIFKSLQWLIMAVVGGMGNIWGGLAGTAFLTVTPELFHKFEDFHTIFFGLTLIIVLMFRPRGLLPSFRNSSQNLKEPSPIGVVKSGHKPIKPLSKGKENIMKLEQVSLSFGGLQILNNINLEFHSSKIHAIIGPNGAGKTSLINVISGLFKPQRGSVVSIGKGKNNWQNLQNLPPWRISLAGVARTFQITQIFPTMTVLDHVLIGMDRYITESIPGGLIGLPSYSKKQRRYRAKAMELLERFGLHDKALVRAEELSLFEQKMLEIGRAVAGEPDYLLLDEPAGGLGMNEKSQVVSIINSLRDQGILVIFIDHHLDLVMNLADRIVVLNQGMVIADGSPREVSANEKVLQAYLGTVRGIPYSEGSLLCCR